MTNKLETLTKLLSAPSNVDLWALRECALSEGGFVDSTSWRRSTVLRRVFRLRATCLITRSLFSSYFLNLS